MLRFSRRKPVKREAMAKASLDVPGQDDAERAVASVINRSFPLLDQGLYSDLAQRMIEARSTDGLINAMPWQDFIVSLGATNKPLEDSVRAAQHMELGHIGAVQAGMRLDAVDAISRRYAHEQGAKLVTNITESQRATIRQIAGQALNGEYTIDQAARKIREGIGLHPRWATAVENYRTRLEANPRPVGTSAARHSQQIDRSVERYRDRLVRARSLNIARTEIITAENLGRYASWADSIGQGYNSPESRKEYSPGPGACPICQGLAGEIVGWDQPFSNGVLMPPSHPSCLPATSRIVVPADISERFSGAVSASGGLSDASLLTASTVAETVGNGSWVGISAVTTRHYVGDFIDIVTELGHKLTITPNHPVATRSGFVPAGMIREGDDVLCRAGTDQGASEGPYVKDVETTIKEVADALPVVFGPVPTAAEDFHGDGTEGQVYVVRAASGLLDDVNTTRGESFGESNLVIADVSSGLDAPRGAVGGMFRADSTASDGVVGCVSEGFAPGFIESGHAHVHGRGTSAGFNPGEQEVASDHAAADAEGFCEGLLADSPEIGFAKVVEVKRYFVHTEVYNCNTTDGWYVADGIVVHNCRCGANLLPPLYANNALNPRSINWTDPMGDRAPAVDLSALGSGVEMLDGAGMGADAYDDGTDEGGDGAGDAGTEATDADTTTALEDAQDGTDEFPDYTEVTEAEGLPPEPTVADTLTVSSTAHMSDDELAGLLVEHADDPEAIDRVLEIMDERDALTAAAQASDAAYAAEQQATRDAANVFQSWTPDPDPVTNPVQRSTTLTPRQRASDEYQNYVMSQYDKALEDLNGVLLNKAGRAAAKSNPDVEMNIFTGQVATARKYASEELQQWWGENGRETLASFRYKMFGWSQDRWAAENVRKFGYERGQSFRDRSQF